jgi:hypothetical protein
VVSQIAPLFNIAVNQILDFQLTSCCCKESNRAAILNSGKSKLAAILISGKSKLSLYYVAEIQIAPPFKIAESHIL